MKNKVYIVTYKGEKGALLDRRVTARNHVAAASSLCDAGLKVVGVARATPDDKEDKYVRRTRWSGLPFVFLIGGLALAAVFLIAWWIFR